MKRTLTTITESQYEKYDVKDEPIVISKSIIDLFLKDPEEKFHNLLSLYSFYYYTAKWQKTNQPRCSISYAATGLGWSEAKVRQVKKRLVALGLIEDIRVVEDKTKKVIGWYIKIKFIWGKEKTREIMKESHPYENLQGGSEKPPLCFSHRVENLGGNALSVNNKNALNTNIVNSSGDELVARDDIDQDNLKISSAESNDPPDENKKESLDKYIKYSDFDFFWKYYPRKTGKGEARQAFQKACNLKNGAKPTLRQIRNALISHNKTTQWKSDKKNIPLASTWLNQFRWENTAEEINEKWETVQRIKKEQNEKPTVGTNRIGITGSYDRPPDYIL